MQDIYPILIIDVVIWGTLIFYFRCGKKTRGLVLFIMLAYLISMFAAFVMSAILKLFNHI